VQAKYQPGDEENLSTLSQDLRYLFVAPPLRPLSVKLSTPFLGIGGFFLTF
jgi:hypothetical protein